MKNKLVKNKNDFLFLKKIPVIAIIFPPIGMIMLIKYFLKRLERKNK
tara:strand:+ start:190 stop:330 length:141 start_codon:yes stop_codon:yes gene_type:complete